MIRTTFYLDGIVRFALRALLVTAFLVGFAPQQRVAHAAAVDTLCYAVADGGDRLVTIDRITGGNFVDVGGLGVTQVEAIAWNLDATILYAANASQFGTINIATGEFSLIGAFGSGTGTETPSGDGNVNFSDVDGLAIDPTTGIMYGSVRNGDGSAPDDVLIQIDLSSGAHVPDAFLNDSADYVSIATSAINATLNDVDDIAVDPTDGQMYGVANNSGGNDRLIKIDKATGVVTDVGLLRLADNTVVEDMEGFSFYNDGTFYGTTGSNSASDFPDALWTIDPDTGIVVKVGDFTSYTDYEAVACLVGGSNTIEGTAFEDINANGAWNPGTDSPTQGATVRLYRDADNNGSYETLVDTKITAADGSYSFEVALDGDFRVEVDTSASPFDNALSTPSDYEISFTDFGNTSSNNDFGYVTSGSIGNYVWLDLNGDGVQDADEPGIAGIVVELDNGVCTPGAPDTTPSTGNCPTVTTDADGLYSFPGLDAGTYQVNILSDMAALGLAQTFDPDEAPGSCSTCNENDANINLAQGQVYADADFGFQGSASIGDFIWDDASNDGSYDTGEAGLSGLTVDLTWYGVDGVAGGGDDISFTTTSDGSGVYNFTGLPAGNYSVDPDISTAPAGYVLTTSNDPQSVTLTSGQDYNDADFGLYRAPEATKQLYFSEPGQGLDRIDPVATGDTSTATSAQLSVPQTNYQVRDEFNDGIAYTGNDGSENWTAAWVEVGDDADPDGGKVKVVEKLDQLGYCLDGDFCVEFKTDEVVNQRYLYRQVDMSSAAAGALSATFSFDYYYKLDDADAEMQVQYSCNGGSTWTMFSGGTFDESGGETTGSFSQPIPCTTANTQIRFVNTGIKKDKTFSFDNVDISWELAATPATETFTQGLALVDDLTVPATGDVTVSAYLDVTTGFIDLTQAVPMEAQVRYGGSTLVTLNNPTVTALLPPILNNVADSFPIKGQYDGDTGSVSWIDDWQEDLDGGAPDGGDIKVNDDADCPTGSGNCLEIKSNSPGRAVSRGLNLEGAVSAILTYDFNNTLSGTDRISVEVSSNAGTSYVAIDTHTGAGNGTNDTNTLDITAYASDHTRIRFIVGEKDGADKLFVDNVNITYGVNDSLYLATWTGTVAGNTTIPSGSAISVDVTSSIGGVDMNVLYDSDTRPSQLNMTVSSFINIDTLEIYDAAYSGGSVVTSSDPSDTVYIRATVSDPFGTADITDLDLGVTDVGCGSVSTTLTDGSVVASTASTKTYEYAWNVGSCEGDYLITATGNEGTEGVTARKAVPHTVVGAAEPAVIGNRVWLDENGDGVQDAGEPGIANATVTLDPPAGVDLGAGDGVAITMLTDANGGYLFTDLPSNVAYTVSVTPPSGLNPTYDEDSGTSSPNNSTVVTPASAEEHLTADFGLNYVTPADSSNPPPNATGAIGDRIWNDANGDGIQDPGESGIGGVSVTIFHDPDGDGVYDTPFASAVNQDGVTGSTTTTEPDGSYIFDNLPADGYVVVVDDSTLPAGITWTQTGDPDATLDDATTLPIVLGPGDVVLMADFGYQPNQGSTIGDTIFVDPNGNGTQDSPTDEPGIPGVTVALEDNSGNIIATTVTDDVGNYSFPGLPAGDYTVVVTDTENVLGELDPISDDDGIGTPNESTTSVNGTVDDLDQDFGYAPSGHSNGDGLIGDTIFLDADGSDSFTAGDQPLEGVTVELYDAAGTTLLDSTTTDENGNYFFGGLNATTTYTVKVVATTLPNGGTGLTNSVDPDGATDSTTVVDLNAEGGVSLAEDFGYKATAPNTIEGTVWDDADANGTLDESGAGIPGVTVALYEDSNNNGVIDSGDNLVGTTTTNSSGDYSFPGLPDGVYLVDVTDEDNVLDGYWHSDGLNDGSDNNSQDDPYQVTLSGGNTTNSTADFGYYDDLAAIGNYVWEDINGNGVQDSGEPALAGVEVKLTVTYPNGAGSLELTTVTDANGFYSFANLLADEDYAIGSNTGSAQSGQPDYEITIDSSQPALAGLAPTQVGAGGDSKLDSNDANGATAVPVQGATDVATQSPASSESDAASYDFGFTSPATIGNYVWLDENGDGVQDAGEAGIANVTVTLTPPGDVDLGAGNGVAITTQTDANGGYLFTDLPPNRTYTVSVTPTGGLHATYDENSGTSSPDSQTVVTPTGGEEHLTADFGYNWAPPTDTDSPSGSSTGAIGDTVYNDVNGNGVQDRGESGIGGVDVALYSPGADGILGTPDDVEEDSTTTAADGSYIFDGLDAGSYRVEIDTDTLPDGFTQTGDPDDILDSASSPIVLGPGDVYLNADFGYQPAYGYGNSIGDRVWLDDDGDGIQDAGEAGIGGVLVQVTWLGIDGNPGGGDDVTYVTTTDAGGNYLVDGLPDGNFVVSTAPNTSPGGALAGLTQTFDSDGVGSADTSTVTGLGNGIDEPVTALTEDFGYSPFDPAIPAQGVIGDTIFFDANGNGAPDPGEGIPGVKVTLGGDATDTVITDANGNYSFGNLAAGNYSVTVDPTTLPEDGAGLTNTIDPDGGSANQASVTLATNTSVNLEQDFGYTGTNPLDNSLGDTVWLDANRDGSQGADEPGIAGVVVQLTNHGEDGSPGGGDDVVYRTVTAADGTYLFENLPDGSYSVTTSLSANTAAGGALNGLTAAYDKDGTIATPDGTTPQNLSGGAAVLDVDFGYSPSDGSGDDGVIGDTVYLDANGNGVPDPGEGIPGVKVTLDGSTVVYTDADGNYSFGDLAAGSHTVVVDPSTLPTGLTNTEDPDGGTANQSSVNLATNSSIDLDQDFGYQSTAAGTIGDTVWLDADRDGSQGADEPGIAGVTVALIADSNQNGLWDANEPIIATTTTNANGAYGFTGLSLDDGDGDAEYLVWVNDTDNVLGELVATVDADGAAPAAGQVTGLGISAVALSSASPINNDQDFGYAPPGHDIGAGLIGDTIFLDADGSDSFSGGDQPLEGVTVELYDAAGTTLLDSTTTDENGNYTFGGLNATASYTVKVVTSTLPNGGAGLTNSVDPDGTTDSTTVVNLGAEGGVSLVEDFGYKASAPNTIAGTVWDDADADGTLDESRAGIPGVTVALYEDSNTNGIIDSGDNLVGTTTTGADGDFSFPGLPDGVYLVDVTDEDGVLSGYWHSDGPNDNADNNSQDDPYQVTLNGGNITNSTADFGYYSALAAIGNYIWVDENGNGLQDPMEPGLDGVEVTLTIDYGVKTVILKTVTGDDPSTPNVVEQGWYSFANLLADEDYNGDGAGTEPIFTVSATLPGTSTTPDVGGNEALDADDPAGVTATAVQGTTDVGQQGDAGAEGFSAQVDFAIVCISDWGDLPGNKRYPVVMESNGGRHCVKADLTIGATATTENDGQPEPTGNGDADDGLGSISFSYNQVTKIFTMNDVKVTNKDASGAVAQVVAWIDFNSDGDLDDSNERSLPALAGKNPGDPDGDSTFTTGNIASNPAEQSVTLQWANVDLPLDQEITFFYRVRLTYDATFFSDASPMPDQWVDSGEVEDGMGAITTLPVSLSYIQSKRYGDDVRFVWQTATETANAGFNILVDSGNGLVPANAELIPSQVIDSVEVTTYRLRLEMEADTFYIQEVGIDGGVDQKGPFQVGVTYGSHDGTVERLPDEGGNAIFLPVLMRN